MSIEIKDLTPSQIEELSLDRSGQIMGGLGRAKYITYFFNRPTIFHSRFDYVFGQRHEPKPQPQDCNIRCIKAPCPCTINQDGTSVYN